MLEKQFQFTKMLGELFTWMSTQGYNWSLGDGWRSSDKLQCAHCGREHSYQELLVYNGKSKTVNSKHGDRLAIDINLFDEKRKLAPSVNYLPIGEKWESLGGTWGGRFKPLNPNTKIGWDAGHFEL